MKRKRSHFKELSEWRYSDDRFRLGTSAKETPDESAEKERLIAEFLARKAKQ